MVQLLPEVAWVLAYEVLLGQGCRKSGPAERALMHAKVRFRNQKILIPYHVFSNINF